MVSFNLIAADRFYKVLWGCHGISTGDSPSGVIIAGSENGSVLGYNAAALIGGNEEAPIFRQDKHSGAVKALDFNPFQVVKFLFFNLYLFMCRFQSCFPEV